MSHTSFSLSFSYSKSSCAQHCVSRSKFHAALAGLVDGSFFTSGISAVRQYLENRRYAVSPLAQMRRMSAVFKITSMSFAVTLRIELSDDPAMSQEAMTSHSAIWCSNKNRNKTAVLSTLQTERIPESESGMHRHKQVQTYVSHAYIPFSYTKTASVQTALMPSSLSITDNLPHWNCPPSQTVPRRKVRRPTGLPFPASFLRNRVRLPP